MTCDHIIGTSKAIPDEKYTKKVKCSSCDAIVLLRPDGNIEEQRHKYYKV